MKRGIIQTTNDYSQLLYSLFVGLLAGVIGSGFRIALDHIKIWRELLYQITSTGSYLHYGMIIGITIIAVVTSVFLVKKYAHEAGGSGVQEIEGALDGLLQVRWQRILPIKFLSSLFSLGSGMTLGKEGPTIQISACLGKMIQEKFKLSEDAGHILLAAGAAAGLAAAFNAPFASLIFIMEEMRSQFKYSFHSFQCIIIAVIASDIVVRILCNQGPIIEMHIFNSPQLSTLYLFPVLGIIIGIMGLCFNKSVLFTLNKFSQIPSKYSFLPAILIAIIISITGMLCYNMIGGGYLLFHDLFYESLAFNDVLIHLIVRFILIILCYSSGVAGGIFVPMLTLGALSGTLFGMQIQCIMPALELSPEVFALCGMAAIFASTIRAPVTGIVLVIEMTNNTNIMLPLMLTASVSALTTTLLGNRPIYTSLLKRKLLLLKMEKKMICLSSD